MLETCCLEHWGIWGRIFSKLIFKDLKTILIYTTRKIRFIYIEYNVEFDMKIDIKNFYMFLLVRITWSTGGVPQR
jgi:hypothetical protein